MKLLAIESSGLSAGCALWEDGVLTGEYYMNSKLTHSRTLLPMIDQLQKTTGFQPEELDAVAISAGPGSFTGLRIGAATAKGLTLALNKPLIPVSSLKALARNLPVPDTLICPLMDARRDQVYCGIFFCCLKDGNPVYEELLPDSALTIQEYLDAVSDFMQERSCRVCFTGDGVPVHQKLLRERFADKAFFAPTSLNRQRAGSVAALAAEAWEKGETVSSDDYVPVYLRKPLAEKEKSSWTGGDPGKHALEKIAKGDFVRTKHPLPASETESQ